MRRKAVEREPLSPERLAAFPLFRGLDAEALREVAATGTLSTFRAGAIVLEHGHVADRLFALLDGLVRVVITDSRGLAVLAKVFAGPAVFGEMEALTGTTFIESVIVERKSTIAELDVAAFRPMLTKHPIICERLLVDVCLRFRTSALNQAFAAFEGVERRLAALLGTYARALGVRVAGGVQIVSPAIAQEALADGIGVTRKSVQRVFAQWTERGIVERRGRALVILDLGALAAAAGENAPRFDHSLG
jgi:CRP-like cAMP-binding protein